MSESERPSFFDMPALRDGFNRALTKHMRDRIEELRSTYINPSNVERFHHGLAWKSLDFGSQSPSESEIVPHAHETAIPFARIVAHDLSMVSAQVEEVTSAMYDQFQKHLFQTLEQATSRAGNVVSAAKVGGLAEGFLESLQKIEFGVDKDGQVSRPSFHLAPEMFDKMRAAVEAKGPEFAAKIEQVTRDKEAQALEREKARKARFATPDE